MTRHVGVMTAVVLAGLPAVGCGRAGPAPSAGAGAGMTRSVSWTAFQPVRGVVDLSAPRSGGGLVVAAAGRLRLLAPDRRTRPIDSAYSAPSGLEPYIALSLGQRVAAARCSFARDSLFALRLDHGNGVTVVDPRGHVRRFVELSGRGLENGIAFDAAGRFGHRLLVSSATRGRTTVYAIDCRGRVQVLTRSAPRFEGGIAVAPSDFGAFAGDLIVPDELSGRIYAIGPDGRSRLVVDSRLAHGQDVGVESEGVVPPHFREALVADRRTPHNRHPGDDVILGLPRAALAGAGARPGDLLAVTEGGASTVAVRCRRSCRVRAVATGPGVAHIEGHVVFER